MSRLLILCFVLIPLVVTPQTLGVHALHKSMYKIEDTAPIGEASIPIIPLAYDKSKVLGKSVFGYLPDWEVQGSASSLRYDLLTHLAVFDFAMDSLGNLKNPSYWPWTSVINTAHTNGVKVILCVTNFEGSEITYFLDRPTARQNFFQKLASLISQYAFDGVNIDFESLRVSDRGERINSFMAELSAYLKNLYPTTEISFAGPAVNWSGWNLLGLANACDYVFIMGYDFYGSWSTTTGANAPLTGGSYNITNTVQTQYAQAVASVPHKLILGVPYFGVEWTAETSAAYAPVVAYIGHPRYRIAEPNAQLYGVLWDTKSKTAWYRYQTGSTWRQIWYDNDSSLALKYDLALSKNLKGIGMWALGYDNGRTELWNLIQRKIFDPSSVSDTRSVPSGFSVEPLFPNPFNPEASVRFTVPEYGEYQVALLNTLGEKVYSNTGTANPGNNQFTIHGRGLSSGVYFLTISFTGETSGKSEFVSQKCILLK